LPLSQVLPSEFHENIPPLPAKSLSRNGVDPGIAHAVSTCKPKNELSIFDSKATTAVKYGTYCGKVLLLFPARHHLHHLQAA
jgi:hypothetical protein